MLTLEAEPKFVSDMEANKLLTRDYREPYVLQVHRLRTASATAAKAGGAVASPDQPDSSKQKPSVASGLSALGPL